MDDWNKKGLFLNRRFKSEIPGVEKPINQFDQKKETSGQFSPFRGMDDENEKALLL